MIEQAPAWAKLMCKEIKSQAVQYGQMKVQLTAFKAVVNQRLNEHEKTQEFINSRFEDIELQNDHLNRDMDAIRESVEDKEEVIQQLLSRVDELEQYSRRECLVLNGVKENPHETEDEDEIVLDVISQKLGVKISSNDDVQRCHRLKTRRPRHSPVERQSPRPIIIKFVSYTKRQEVFTSKKKLKRSGLVLNESLTATRQAVVVACEQGRGEKGEKERVKERGACRNTPIYRLQQRYNLCGIIN